MKLIYQFLLILFIFSSIFAQKNPCDVDTVGSKNWMKFISSGKYKLVKSAGVEVSSTSGWDPKKYQKLLEEDFLGTFAIHTEKEKHPYVILDFKKKIDISGILIVNRADAMGRRTTNLRVNFSNNKKKWKNIYRTGVAQDVWEVILPKPTQTRYLKVWLYKTEFLHLAQILVYVPKFSK